MNGDITSVKIRMYNTGSVGDCLLLLFMEDTKIAFRMMIDCGGWNTTGSLVTPCVEDITSTCNGELDLLVVTHQHEDHVSGFNQARTVFDAIKVKEVWMSWIENPEDPVGKTLKEKYGKTLKELKRSIAFGIDRLNEMGGGDKRMREMVNAKKIRMIQAMELLKFEEGMTYGKKFAAGKRTNDDAMNYVKGKGDSIRYVMPGQVIKNKAGAKGIKFYILGPPRDKDMKYFKIDEEEDEMYKLALRVDALPESQEEEELPVGGIFMNDIALDEFVSPFRDEYKLTGKDKTGFQKMYNSQSMKWRQIETDWFESDAGIALRVNRLTNNTSLAMAIELGNGHVVLLPGDAQSGNWLGWHKKDVQKKLKDRGGKDTNELLRDTVFYKVGHHGSHNGTASKSGLDKMMHEDLVAMMPLVQAKVPSAWGGSKNFPAGPLYEELITRTHGRVIRTDVGVIKKATAVTLRNGLSAVKKKVFTGGYKKGSCFVEYTLQCKVED